MLFNCNGCPEQRVNGEGEGEGMAQNRRVTLSISTCAVVENDPKTGGPPVRPVKVGSMLEALIARFRFR